MLLPFLDWEERLSWDGNAAPASPSGALAAMILRTTGTDTRSRRDAVRRLTRWVSTSPGVSVKRVVRFGHDAVHTPNTASQIAAESLTLIAQQLQEWFEQGSVSWNADYSPLVPHDGP